MPLKTLCAKSTLKLACMPCSFTGAVAEELKHKQVGWAAWHVVYQAEGLATGFSVPAHRVVYLTADGDEELADLRDDEMYVIGGLVDHNRHKGICLQKGREAGVRTAKLPLSDHMRLFGSKVCARGCNA